MQKNGVLVLRDALHHVGEQGSARPLAFMGFEDLEPVQGAHLPVCFPRKAGSDRDIVYITDKKTAIEKGASCLP